MKLSELFTDIDNDPSVWPRVRINSDYFRDIKWIQFFYRSTISGDYLGYQDNGAFYYVSGKDADTRSDWEFYTGQIEGEPEE